MWLIGRSQAAQDTGNVAHRPFPGSTGYQDMRPIGRSQAVQNIRAQSFSAVHSQHRVYTVDCLLPLPSVQTGVEYRLHS